MKVKKNISPKDVAKVARRPEKSYPAGKVPGATRPGDRAGAFRGGLQEVVSDSARTVRGMIERSTRHV